MKTSRLMVRSGRHVRPKPWNPFKDISLQVFSTQY